MLEKKCGKCHVIKPLSDFHKDKGKKDGFNWACKTCQTGRLAIYKEKWKNKNPYKDNPHSHKICTSCQKLLPLIKFSIKKNLADGLNYFCKDCISNKNSKYNKYLKEKSKEYKRRAINKWKNKNPYTLTKNKQCNVCQKILLSKEFRINKRNPDRLYYTCKKCVGLKTIERLYGISANEKEMLIKIQDNKCAICGRKSNKELSVDHNHETGVARMLLCVKCNNMLGGAEDNIKTLQTGIEYLKSF